MSSYTIGEILLWLLIAAVLGGLIGWILRSLRGSGSGQVAAEADVLVGASAGGDATARGFVGGGAAPLVGRAELDIDKEFGVSGGLDGLRSRFGELSTVSADLDDLGAEFGFTGGVEGLRARLGELTSAADAGAGDGGGADVDVDAAIESALGAKFGVTGGIAGVDNKIGELEADAGEAEAELDAYREHVASLEAELGMKAAPSPAEAAGEVSKIAERTAGGGSVNDDDLTLIHGVGPKINRLLKSMGITSYRQVAQLSSDDLRHVSAALGTFPDRIARDDWMSSAAELHREHHGEDLGVKPAVGGVAAAQAREQMRDIAERTAGGGSVGDDDLTRVHGVGPKIRDLLKSMGITSFKQIARFGRDDIETVSAALEVFPNRIVRDDWMSSARELHQEDYGEDPLT